MTPVVQLNLADLALNPLGSLPPVLVQIWGNLHRGGTEASEFTRIIPLATTHGNAPDPNYRTTSNPVLGFEREGSIGDVIVPNERWRFSLGQRYFAHMMDIFEEESLPENMVQSRDKILMSIERLDECIDDDHFLALDGGFFWRTDDVLS